MASKPPIAKEEGTNKSDALIAKQPTMTEHPSIEPQFDLNFSKYLKDALQLLRSEMQEEIHFLK